MILLLLSFCSCARPAPGATVRVLFIGNSFTSANDLPALLAGVAASLGDKIEADSLAPGGYGFEQHARDAATRTLIGSKEWDFVVLQEQSQRPALPEFQVAAEVIPYALQLDKLVRTLPASAKTVFFETWGRRDGDRDNCRNIPEVCTYEGMQRRLSATYADLAVKTGGLLAPVGTAWKGVRAAHPEIELYSGDGIHPSKEGSYLAACVFYSVLFGKSPVGAADLGLGVKQASILQKAAAASVLPPGH